MTQLIAVGFWRSGMDDDAYPHPGFLARYNDPLDDHHQVSAYLEAGETLAIYKGVSCCRCKKEGEPCTLNGYFDMGNKDFTDGVYVWPEGYVHYLKDHNIMLTPSFLKHIRSNGYSIPSDALADAKSKDRGYGRYDYSEWVSETAGLTFSAELPESRR